MIAPETAGEPLERAARFRRWGREADAVRAYEAALFAPADRDERYVALTGLASALDALGRSDEAVSVCHRAIAQRPDAPEAYAILALVHLHAGDLFDAARRAGEACTRRPRAPELLCLAASIALRRGAFDEAADGAEKALLFGRENARARSLAALAELAQGKPCLDLDAPRLVRRALVPTAPGFDAALTEAISADPALAPSRPDAVLQGGWRLDDAFTLDSRLTDPLRALVLEQVELLSADLATSSAHAHLAVAPERLAVRGWANVIQAGHRETPHIHERAWMCVVYYPEVPAAEGGEIVFGPHDLGPAVPAPESYTIAPEASMLIAFPAHLYHSTRPFAGNGNRISVAFDVFAS